MLRYVPHFHISLYIMVICRMLFFLLIGETVILASKTLDETVTYVCN